MQAFRPGIVDLPEDQIKASKNAITFSDARNDFDFFDWSVGYRTRAASDHS
jgi:cohesin complex subunit SCC1